ncbi:MAG: GNAT family N-acetyltransferase [Paludisphaera borealis]|uniref:GNAT family N-acetyltransferase n=1 Tax=Paludisphaera borealis TaxID=1387353 RepID=UPI0028406046|nr:GNAT family N-acetyltransferase [Paludisphaera borealis]MDR3620155.1 GNAT family N-acetyltransferase [Paludisphaera borealis]
MADIRPMTADDVADGMRLKAEAGWNQIAADWERFLSLDRDGCFVAECQGRVVGSVTSCRFGPVAWIAMVLVEKARRGAGIGRNLLVHALDHLEAAGARSIRLDATSLGRPLYESLGFRVDFHLDRHSGIVETAEAEETSCPARPADLDGIAALDRIATGTDRRILVDRLLRDNPLESLVAVPIRGFALWRPGSSADQIGPCIAEPDAGQALLNDVGRRLAGRRVIVDIPTDNVDAVAWAERAGLKPSREFWRMTRGEPVVEDLDRLWASSGPEMG